MKKIHRVLAVLMAVVMALSLITTAFAEPTIDTSKKASLSIYKYDITKASEEGVWDAESYVSTGLHDDAVIDKLSKYIILKLKPCHQKDSWYRWEQEVPAGSPAELVKAAHEFSALKVGYRGDLAFQNAEVIDVPRFLAEGITRGEPVQTNAELRDALIQCVEREQTEYTESLYRMTQSELIANAGEIEATRYCYNALLTANLERYQMLLLLSDGYPLTCMRDAWQTEQDVDRDDEFRHTVFRLCEDLQENQQDLTM